MNLRFIRKALATVSAIAIALSAIIIPSSPVVSAAEWFTPYVNALFDLGIVDSTGNAYRPGDDLNRAEFSAIINRIMGFAVSVDEVTNPGFSDVSPSDWFYLHVAALQNAGIVQGRTPTTFAPGAKLNRAEAAKMIALAFDLPTSDAGVPFTDVASGDWFYPYVSALYNNSIVDGIGGTNKFDPSATITRAAIAKMASLAIVVSEAEPGTYTRVDGTSAFADYSAEEIVALVTGGEMPVIDDETPAVDVSSSSLRVALASDSPAAATIPRNGFNVPYTYLTFSAGSEEGVKVTGLTVTRTGLGTAGDFANIKLYQGMTQLSSEKTISSQHNTAVFNLNSTPVNIAAGSSKTIRVLGDMLAGGSTVGVSNQLGVVSANDVTAVGAQTGGVVTVSGSFPVYGGLMTTSGAQVGTLTYEMSDPHGATASTFYIGDQNRVMTRMNLQTTTEDMDVVAVTFRQEGSAGSDEVANLSLYHNGVLVAGPVQIVDRYVTFEFNTPLFIERGSSVNLELRGDIVGGYNKDVGFDIYRDWHINAVGRVYGYPVRVTKSLAAGQTITADNITGSRLSFSIGQRNPTVGDVKPNAKDFVALQFNIINTGDTVDIRNLPVGVNVTGGTITPNMVSDVKIWRLDNDHNFVNVVAGPLDPSSTTVGGSELLAFSDVFEVPANTTAKFAVTYDLQNTAPATQTVSVSLVNPDGTSAAPFNVVTSGFEVRNVGTGDIIYNSSAAGSKKINIDIAGNARTIALPSLDFNVANSPATDAFVVNSTNVPLVAFNAKAGSADDVVLTSLNMTLASGAAGTPVRNHSTCSATAATAIDLSSVKLYAVANGTETLLDGPEEISGTTVNFTGFNLTVPAGETVRILVRANIPSSAGVDVCPTMSIAAATAVSANDSDGKSLSTTTQITVTDGNTTPTAFVLAAGSGKLRVTAANDTPSEGQVIAGAADVPVAKLKFEASTVEDVEVQKLRLYNANTTSDPAVATVKLWDGDTQVASGTLSGTYVTWESLALLVPRNSSKDITVTVTFNSSATITNIAGMAPRFVIRNLEDNWADGTAGSAPNNTIGTGGDIKAVGKQSGQLLNNAAGATDAIAGDRGFSTSVTNNTVCDAVGHLTGALTTCAINLTGNTLTEAQYVYNTKLTLSLEGGTNGTPVGNQGSAAGAGAEVTIFKFRVAAAANATATNPREVILNDLYFTVSGDTEADNFKLYGPSSGTVVMATPTAAVTHRTSKIACATANPTANDCNTALEKGTYTTVVPFNNLTGTDSKIAYGSSKVYTLKAFTYAVTDNNSPVRSLRVYLANYGTSAGGSDLTWLDNGTTTQNANTKAVFWVHEEGVNELRPSSPMTYSTSSSSIDAGTGYVTAPVVVSARTTNANTVEVFFDTPLDPAVAGFAGFSIEIAAAATVGGPNGQAAAAATVLGNKVTITDTTGALFGTADWTTTYPWCDVAAAAVQLSGPAASGGNTANAADNDNSVSRNF